MLNVFQIVVFHRYSANGDSFRTISASFCIERSTVSSIIPQVCDALWEKLSKTHLMAPTCKDLLEIASQFKEIWHFPHCIGVMDGKHVVLQCPKNSGSLLFNYKGTFSIVFISILSLYPPDLQESNESANT